MFVTDALVPEPEADTDNALLPAKICQRQSKACGRVAQALLNCCRGGSLAGSEKGAPPGTWQWPNRETHLVRGMLRALHTHCLQNLHSGWTTLEQTAFRLRSAPTLPSSHAERKPDPLCCTSLEKRVWGSAASRRALGKRDEMPQKAAFCPFQVHVQ